MLKIFKKIFNGGKNTSDQKDTTLPIDNILWNESQIHLMILGHFMSPKLTEKAVPKYWAYTLGGDVQIIIDRLYKQGALIPVSLEERIGYCSKVPELKKILKENGLKISGNKQELIERLLKADPQGMADLFQDHIVLMCSPEARDKVSQYNLMKKSEFDEVVEKTLSALRGKNFKIASQLIDNYEKNQVVIEFHNSMTLKEPPRDTTNDIEDLKIIFSMRPKILKELALNEWGPLCIVTAMSHLLHGRMSEEWFPSDFVGVQKFNKFTAWGMMRNHFLHISEKEKMKGLGVKKGSVRVISGDCCEACKKNENKIFDLNSFPEIPIESCTSPWGCRCGFSPIIEFKK